MFSRNILKYSYYNITQFDLYLKCFCKNYLEISKLNKIVLYFNFNNSNSISEKKKKLLCIFVSFLITNQLGKFIPITNLNNNSHLVCYKTSLRKDTMFLFLFYLFNFIFPNSTAILKDLKNEKSTFTLSLNNLFLFPEVSSNLYEFLLIHNESLNVTFVTNSKNNNYLKLFLSSFIL